MSVTLTIDDKEATYDTVADLIEWAQQLDPNLLIIQARDPEGNGYSPWAGWFTSYYQPTSTWSGEIVDPDEKNGDGSFYYSEEEREQVKESSTPCVVLVPVN